MTSLNNYEHEFRVAAAKSDLAQLQQLLSKIADINAQGPDSKRTALHFAVMYNTHGDVIEWLKNNGADGNMPDKDGNTPFHLACKNKKIGQYLALLVVRPQNKEEEDAFTRKPLATPGLNPFLPNNEGKTPFDYFLEWVSETPRHLHAVTPEVFFPMMLMNSCKEQYLTSNSPTPSV